MISRRSASTECADQPFWIHAGKQPVFLLQDLSHDQDASRYRPDRPFRRRVRSDRRPGRRACCSRCRPGCCDRRSGCQARRRQGRCRRAQGQGREERPRPRERQGRQARCCCSGRCACCRPGRCSRCHEVIQTVSQTRRGARFGRLAVFTSGAAVTAAIRAALALGRHHCPVAPQRLRPFIFARIGLPRPRPEKRPYARPSILVIETKPCILEASAG